MNTQRTLLQKLKKQTNEILYYCIQTNWMLPLDAFEMNSIFFYFIADYSRSSSMS